MSGFSGVDVLDEFQHVPDLLSYREHYPFVNDKTGSKPETLCLAKGLALPAFIFQICFLLNKK